MKNATINKVTKNGVNPEIPEHDSLVELDQLRAQYPDSSEYTIKTYIYKFLNGQKTLMKTTNGIPDPIEEIQKSFGGGSYKLYVNKVSNGKWETLQMIPIVIYGEELPGMVSGVSPGVVSQAPGGANNLLEAYKQLKELGLIPDKANDNNGTSQMFDVMKECLLVMVKGTASNVGTPTNPLSEKLIDVLLKTSLEKRNPMTELKELLEIKNLITPESDNKKGGGFFDSLSETAGEALGKSLPLLLSPGNQNNNTEVNATVISELRKMKEVNLALIRKMEQMEKDLYIDENNIDPGNNDEKIILTNSSDPDKPDLTIDQFQNKEINEMSIFANALKSLPEEEKILWLQRYIESDGIEVTKKWCMDNKLVESEQQFNEWLQKAGHDPVGK